MSVVVAARILHSLVVVLLYVLRLVTVQGTRPGGDHPASRKFH